MVSLGRYVVLASLALGLVGCVGSTSESRVVWHERELAPEAPAPVQAPAVQRPAATPELRIASMAGSPSATPGRPVESDKALEVLVRASSLELGWTDEAPEAVDPWPPAGPAQASLPLLVKRATEYASREAAAATARPGNRFDGFARVRIEPGPVTTTEHLSLIVRSLEDAGFRQIGIRVGHEPLEVRVPLLPRALAPQGEAEVALSFAVLRWRQANDGVWVDGEIGLSGAEPSPEFVVDSRPDLRVGLRSAWSCSLVSPEPTFNDAVRRTTSALQTFGLKRDLPIYLELEPGASFAEAWQLAREMHASGHDSVSFLARDGHRAVASSCPRDVGNRKTLEASTGRFLSQPRMEGVRPRMGLDFVVRDRAANH